MMIHDSCGSNEGGHYHDDGSGGGGPCEKGRAAAVLAMVPFSCTLHLHY